MKTNNMNHAVPADLKLAAIKYIFGRKIFINPMETYCSDQRAIYRWRKGLHLLPHNCGDLLARSCSRQSCNITATSDPLAG